VRRAISGAQERDGGPLGRFGERNRRIEALRDEDGGKYSRASVAARASEVSDSR
jgi:hypothetical protein